MKLRCIGNIIGRKNEAKNKDRTEEYIETQGRLHNLVSSARNGNAVSWLRVKYFNTVTVGADIVVCAYNPGAQSRPLQVSSSLCIPQHSTHSKCHCNSVG